MLRNPGGKSIAVVVVLGSHSREEATFNIFSNVRGNAPPFSSFSRGYLVLIVSNVNIQHRLKCGHQRVDELKVAQIAAVAAVTVSLRAAYVVCIRAQLGIWCIA